MRIYLTFLVLAVVIGGSSLGPRLSRRPVLILAACAALGAVFFTYRSV